MLQSPAHPREIPARLRASLPDKPSIVEMLRDDLIRLCGPRQWNDNRKSWLGRGAEAAGISCRQARRIFNREINNPGGFVLWSILHAAHRLDQAITSTTAVSGVTAFPNNSKRKRSRATG